MSRQPADRMLRRKMFVAACYTYIFLGMCSIVAGVFIYTLPLFLGQKHPPHIDVGLGFVIAVLIGFGMLRVTTAVINLRRLNRTVKS